MTLGGNLSLSYRNHLHTHNNSPPPPSPPFPASTHSTPGLACIYSEGVTTPSMGMGIDHTSANGCQLKKNVVVGGGTCLLKRFNRFLRRMRQLQHDARTLKLHNRSRSPANVMPMITCINLDSIDSPYRVVELLADIFMHIAKPNRSTAASTNAAATDDHLSTVAGFVANQSISDNWTTGKPSLEPLKSQTGAAPMGTCGRTANVPRMSNSNFRTWCR